MKIAINCAFFQPRGGGIKEYIQNLVENLNQIDKANEYILYVLEDYLIYARSNLKCSFKIKAMPFKGNSTLDVIKRSILENYFWQKEEELEQWDLFHSPFFHGPKLKNTPLILTVHDMRFYRFPDTYTFLRYQFLKRTVKHSILRAKHIISISDFTKNEICKAYKINPSKITTIHEAININHFSLQTLSSKDKEITENLKCNYILAVGHMEPRKNYNRLIKAFEYISVKYHLDLKLVIVGKKAHNYEETIRLIESNPNIVYLNFVSDSLLNWLYKNAKLFVFPSYYEGFGFPPLEAAAHGTISTVSNVSSIPEVCGNAATYFNPFDIEDIANKIYKLLTDFTLRENLKQNLETQLKKFSWKRNAEETLNIYNELFSKDMTLGKLDATSNEQASASKSVFGT